MSSAYPTPSGDDDALVPFTASRPVNLAIVPKTKGVAAPAQYVWALNFAVANWQPEEMPKNVPQQAIMNFNHYTAVSHFIQIHQLGGTFRKMYVAWVVEANKAKVKGLFTFLNLHKVWLDLIEGNQLPKPNIVYVEGHNGGPLGRWLHQIASRLEHTKGFFIQMFGKLNSNPCSECEESFRRSFREIDGQKIQLMWPFFECVSCPTINDGSRTGRCGNCQFNDRICSYENQKLPQKVRGWRAAKQLTESPLNETSAPLGAEVKMDLDAVLKRQATLMKKRK